MAATLIATVGASNANSYATVDQGNAYHETHLYPEAWTDASADEKAIALIWATRLLETAVEWDGRKATNTQALRWPRYGVEDEDGYTVPSDSIPQPLVDATAELARYLLSADPGAGASGGLAAGALQSLKVGPIALEYAEGATSGGSADYMPDQVVALISVYGRSKSGGAGMLHRV